jgi:hypothetical protein
MKGKLPMELKIRHRGGLLPQMLKAPYHVESVERALERQVGVDAVKDLRERIEDVQTLTPRQTLHVDGREHLDA